MAEDSEKVNKHRTFLRNREIASAQGLSYPLTRSSKEINEGTDPERVDQRKGLMGTPIQLNLRQRRKRR